MVATHCCFVMLCAVIVSLWYYLAELKGRRRKGSEKGDGGSRESGEKRERGGEREGEREREREREGERERERKGKRKERVC